ncbi:MAG: hypothetical protein NTX01_01355 [Candidatus Omnitrophica bacterium]|nr:hypothetical protein [Candidatus Omnitrophota bacterium]
MKGAIKGVLAEELQNSLRMEKEYKIALNKLPKGCLSLKNIKGHKYYYLVNREKDKLRYVYKGKLSDDQIKKYKEDKEYKDKYRKSLSKLKKQVKFLRSSLRGKAAV